MLPGRLKSVELSAVATAVVLVLLVALAALPLDVGMKAFAVDDALYYPVIAMNIVDGEGVTLDGQTQTNGVHPLWQLLWVPAAAIASGDADVLLRIGFLMAAAVAGVGYLMLRGVFRQLGLTGGAAAAVILVSFFTRADLWMTLLEAALTLALVLLAISLALRGVKSAPGIAGSAIFGAVLGALFLARLDTVFLIPALFIPTVFTWRRAARERLLHAAVVIAATVTVTIPYLLWNLLSFGNLVPVSGTKKMDHSFSPQEWAESLLLLPRAIAGKTPGPDVAWGVVGVAAGAVTVVLLRRAWVRRRADPLAVGFGIVLAGYAAGVVVRYLYLTWAFGSAAVPWYFVPEYVLVWLMAAVALDEALRLVGVRPARVLVAGGLLLLLVAGPLYLLVDGRKAIDANGPLYQTGIWARDNLPGDAVAAMYDPGYLAFLSGRDTVGLNGLATDFRTMRQLERGERLEVLQRLEVEYLAVILSAGTGQEFPASSIVYRSPPFPAGATYAGASVFVLDLGGPEVVETLARLGY